MSWRRHYDALVDATRPPPGAVERLRARAALRRSLLRAVATPPAPGATERLRARLARGRRRRRLLPLVAIAAAVAVTLAGLAVRSTRSVSFDEPLRAAAPTDRAVGPDVRLTVEGEGGLHGTERAPRITWIAGTLDVDVTPDRGADVRVETDEAEVRVVGTRFRVVRDALGTFVDVDRGHVAVHCAGGAGGESSDHLLGAGRAVVCPPTRPAGMLARAFTRVERGDPPAEVLGEVNVAIGLLPAGDPVRAELQALRIELLVRAGRATEAAAAGAEYLSDPDAPRREEVERLLRSIP